MSTTPNHSPLMMYKSTNPDLASALPARLRERRLAKLYPSSASAMAFLPLRMPAMRSLAVPSVCLLICFLAYSSQYLFYHLEPGPLSTNEAIWFNLVVAGTWWSYERACRVDPGRLPKSIADSSLESPVVQNEDSRSQPRRGRWCKKCEAVKPRRAHHCRQCGR